MVIVVVIVVVVVVCCCGGCGSDTVVPCAVPVQNVSCMLFQDGRSSNFSKDGQLDRLHTLAIIHKSSVY